MTISWKVARPNAGKSFSLFCATRVLLSLVWDRKEESAFRYIFEVAN